MSFVGGGGSDDVFLVGPILEWWDQHTAKRDAKRAAKADAAAAAKHRNEANAGNEH